MTSSTNPTVTTWFDPQLGRLAADGIRMDRHVRWFRREIAVGVAQRLTLETLIAGSVAPVVLLVQGRSVGAALIAMVLVMPVFAFLRVGLALAANPLNSAYLLRWPHPESTIIRAEPTRLASPIDTALMRFGFSLRGAFDEWGGATTNVYTMKSDQIIVTTSDEDEAIAITALTDRRLVVTTTQLIPPHERLIVNRVDSPDVRSLLASHLELVKALSTKGSGGVVRCTMDHVIELLAIEWDAWDQIGPLLGPFVGVGQPRQPTLLQVHVKSKDILGRTAANRPVITAHGTERDAGVVNSAPERPQLRNVMRPPTETDRAA